MRILTTKQVRLYQHIFTAIMAFWIILELMIGLILFSSFFYQNSFFGESLRSIMINLPLLFVFITLLITFVLLALTHIELLKLKNSYIPIDSYEYSSIEDLLLSHKSIYQFGEEIRKVRSYILQREKYHMYNIYNYYLNKNENNLLKAG